ncbi:hypothetical protein RUM43_011743 [Polyplax serrata]|uniref:Uncharacterized protein n=1 Tax=Polyplax serrata TaxID=468196 RepID=A0AAN8P6F1_POLSC
MTLPRRDRQAVDRRKEKKTKEQRERLGKSTKLRVMMNNLDFSDIKDISFEGLYNACVCVFHPTLFIPRTQQRELWCDLVGRNGVDEKVASDSTRVSTVQKRI